MSAPTSDSGIAAFRLAASIAKTDRLRAIIERDEAEAVRYLMLYELISLRSDRATSTLAAATELALALLDAGAAYDVDLSDWE